MTRTESRYRRWYGRDEPPLPQQVVSAGPLSLLVDGVDVRRVTYAGTTVMDRIFVAIRDPDWGTLPAMMDGPIHRADDPAAGVTTLAFHVRHADTSIRFAWEGRITVGPGPRVDMEMDGVAEDTFRYARMGLCALLPARSMAGCAYRTDGAGESSEGTLPVLVAPQPVIDGVDVPLIPAFRELEVSLPDVVVHHRFEGDDFELEDQRNWTDDSFKAYSLMSGEPNPRTARSGQRFRQRVTLTVMSRTAAGRGPLVTSPRAGSTTISHPREVGVSLVEEGLRWPAIGLGDTSDDDGLELAEIRALAALRLDHVRVDLHPGRTGWHDRLRRGAAGALAVGAGLELALSLDEPAIEHLAVLPGMLAGVPVTRILVLHWPTQGTASTPSGWVARARRELGDALPETRWICGTDGDFAEINRDRPVPGGVDAADGICYGLNPQIHASDESSMVETLPAQGVTVTTARSWYPAGDVCVSPVTLRQRFNPAAASSEANRPDDEAADVTALPAGVDPRQRSLFGAGWTLGSIASLTAAGATSATWYATAGWRGLFERSRPPARPGWEPVVPGEVYPTYHLFRDLDDRRQMTPLRCHVTEERDVVALGMRSATGVRLLMANLTPRPVRALVEGLPRGVAESWMLDETTPAGSLDGLLDHRVRQQMVLRDGAATIELPPFASVRLDVTSSG